MESITQLYYEYLCEQVNPYDNDIYDILEYLWNTDFEACSVMDESRASDGINLRYDFGEFHGFSRSDIFKAFKHKSCSVLEMMTALAIRLEEHILGDDRLDDRTSEWFEYMLDSLGVFGYKNLDDDVMDEIMDRFMSREYTYDGDGGLFYLADSPKDMRELDIWYQAMEFAKRVIKQEENNE